MCINLHDGPHVFTLCENNRCLISPLKRSNGYVLSLEINGFCINTSPVLGAHKGTSDYERHKKTQKHNLDLFICLKQLVNLIYSVVLSSCS